MEDSNKTQGFVRLECRDRNGELKWDTGFMKNLGTNARLAVLSGLAGNTGTQTAFTYLALGTSSTAVSAAHTALQAEITDTGLQRASGIISRVTTTQTNDTLQLVKSWTSTGTKTVEEIGVFNDPTAGVMAGRCVTGSKSLVSGDVLTATYKIVFS